MNALTFPQLELWVHHALAIREQRADLTALKFTEQVVDILVAAKILTRTG